jgi:hypothetical protein
MTAWFEFEARIHDDRYGVPGHLGQGKAKAGEGELGPGIYDLPKLRRNWCASCWLLTLTE